MLSPHLPPHHKYHKTTPPHPEIPTNVCHIVIIFIIFCGIRWYFLHILIVSYHGGATALNRLSHKTIFSTGPHCVRSRSNYSLKQDSPWIFFCLFILIYCLPVHENNEHVQGWNHTTTTSFFSNLICLVSICYYYFDYVFL